MNKSLYVIGSEPLHEWERRNNYPSCIVLTGNVSANTFSEFAHDFDYTKYKQISFDELFVGDILYKMANLVHTKSIFHNLFVGKQ